MIVIMMIVIMMIVRKIMTVGEGNGSNGDHVELNQWQHLSRKSALVFAVPIITPMPHLNWRIDIC